MKEQREVEMRKKGQFCSGRRAIQAKPVHSTTTHSYD